MMNEDHTVLSGGEEGVSIDHPPLSGSKLCDSFMQVGSMLFSACPDLFSNALLQLSNQFSLSMVKNPSLIRLPPPNRKRMAALAAEERASISKKTKLKPLERTVNLKHTVFRKYVLPKDAPPEYYQCMECGEQRSENSFHSDHIHFGKRPKVRWFCPICKAFFAVTHRSGHIRCRHPSPECADPVIVPSSAPSPSVQQEHLFVSEQTERDPVRVKEEKIEVEEEEEEEICEPPVQKRHCCSHESEESTICTSSSPVFSSPSTEDLSANDFLGESELTDSTLIDSTLETTPASTIQQVPSATLLFRSASSTGDDILPAFRCPSYVLMPDSSSVSASTISADDSSDYLYL